MKRPVVILAVSAAVVAGPAAVALAATQPAPPAQSSATAAQVDGVVSIGHTSAYADGQRSNATANPLEVGGKTVIGGSSAGGRQSGSAFDTGSSPLGRLVLAPWEASAGGGASSGDAALARAYLLNPNTAQLGLLESRSTATYGPAASHGHSSSDAASVNLGNGSLALLLLYSQADSSGRSSSYLVGINGQEIGTSGQANGRCALTLPQLLQFSCLTASGGTGAGGVTSSSAQVARLVAANGRVPVSAISTTSKGGSAPYGPTAARAAGRPAAAPASGPASSARGTLPFTGFDVAKFVALGALLIVAGAWLAARRRRGGDATAAA